VTSAVQRMKHIIITGVRSDRTFMKPGIVLVPVHCRKWEKIVIL